MGKGARAGLVLIGAIVLAVGTVGPSSAQTKEMSDKSVLALMRYAWALVPQKFTTPQGKVIEVDKSKPSDSVVPIETAREVIRVARMSAFAQLCELPDEQRANYQTLMKREEKKWSDQQMLYINQLHLFTVMTLTGKVQLVEKEGDKQVVVQEGKQVKADSCTDTERKKVQAQIMSYVSSAAPPAAAATAAPPAAKAQPTPASQKK